MKKQFIQVAPEKRTEQLMVRMTKSDIKTLRKIANKHRVTASKAAHDIIVSAVETILADDTHKTTQK
ncbi:hypothetical protein [Ostreibacterium oceani]|uniref:CopG family transcriptional regulator n=1 Tax=Ostreibacterium oceani TaxID=2654998 RepID=A0A6N7EY66_9GAMM|nr:hypothetical protein [Ostreibacterium oceani]MPV86893.1 hypothetical protein [Ostreibacterium oceani]